jgi:hypothetical protein
VQNVRMVALVAAAVTVVACAREARQNVDTVAADAGRVGPATPPVPGAFTAADFARLRWLEGRWRGFMPDGKTFYESYTIDNDSTIVKQSYADTTFTNPTDRSVIQLRGTTVSDEGGNSRYVATRIDSMGVDFAPERGANNHFSFAREDATKWNATLRWTDAQGQARSVVYALHRFGR